MNWLNNTIPTGEIVRVVSLEEYRPQSILITNQWGFVIIYCTKLSEGSRLQHYLLLYTVNGDFLRETKIESSVTSWHTYSSMDGFDYICLGDDKGKIYVFEAFFLKLGEPAYRCQSSIVSVRYFRKIDTVFAVTNDGRIIFVSFIPENYVSF